MLPENILFSADPSKDLNHFISSRQHSMITVLVDENTRKKCLPLIEKQLPDHELIIIPSGEEYKNISTCISIWQKMTDLRMDRHSLMIILGGGVLGDMGGFCASTYKRGIDFILIPTTLLAQVDASIGGKLGIDFSSYKNHIGVFQLPALTLLFSGFLKTLPARELRSGFAEVIKHVLISDSEMWTRLSAKRINEQEWEPLVLHSVQFKAQVTTTDPKEKGLRKILNAGHTIGHALESHFIAMDHAISHGEAIAVGLIAESFIASKKGLLREDELNSIKHYIRSVFDKVELSEEKIEQIS
ncbi:MAG TPA: 3-dehydroquinate synthase family protein, partial [Cyclobacteriaceae bacterium]|nr:3-dehydroquinate synthase family protein [Cyclobacteriaceae bacterium]